LRREDNSVTIEEAARKFRALQEELLADGIVMFGFDDQSVTLYRSLGRYDCEAVEFRRSEVDK
jgi:hypothetical protein